MTEEEKISRAVEAREPLMRRFARSLARSFVPAPSESESIEIADEIVGNVMEEIFEDNLERRRRVCKVLESPDPEHFQAFLFRWIKDRWIDWLRKSKGRPTIVSADESDYERLPIEDALGKNPSETLEEQETMRQLAACIRENIEQLSEAERAVVSLRLSEDPFMSYKEISTRLGKSLTNVTSAGSRGLLKFKSTLEGDPTLAALGLLKTN